jgi:hypothetical protein
MSEYDRPKFSANDYDVAADYYDNHSQMGDPYMHRYAAHIIRLAEAVRKARLIYPDDCANAVVNRITRMDDAIDAIEVALKGCADD